jgi:hypothetical protein
LSKISNEVFLSYPFFFMRHRINTFFVKFWDVFWAILYNWNIKRIFRHLFKLLMPIEKIWLWLEHLFMQLKSFLTLTFTHLEGRSFDLQVKVDSPWKDLVVPLACNSCLELGVVLFVSSSGWE